MCNKREKDRKTKWTKDRSFIRQAIIAMSHCFIRLIRKVVGIRLCVFGLSALTNVRKWFSQHASFTSFLPSSLSLSLFHSLSLALSVVLFHIIRFGNDASLKPRDYVYRLRASNDINERETFCQANERKVKKFGKRGGGEHKLFVYVHTRQKSSVWKALCQIVSCHISSSLSLSLNISDFMYDFSRW